MMSKIIISSSLIPITILFANNYKIVDTGQKYFFSNQSYIAEPKMGDSFYGQDATYLGNQFNYTDNKNATVTDNVTGLMWAKTLPKKLSLDEALLYAKSSKIGGFSDWRIPSVKELYSLINFHGSTGHARPSSTSIPSGAVPYINTRYFDFEYPTQRRYIEAQYWTSTDYVSEVMNGQKAFMGVNFADGRIKGYPKYKARYGKAKFYLRIVRGNKNYGQNKFVDNKNGTISDKATNLKWMKIDSKKGMNWKNALKYCESLEYAGVSGWRVPNAKELHSIVDYTRSPDTSQSASINPIFETSSIKNESGQKDFPSFWSSTTHKDGKKIGSNAVYISFGRALGFMHLPRSYSKELMDVHGAGAQRSDPKSGDSNKFFEGRGPQGDVVRINNYVRCVSDDAVKKKKISKPK